MQTISELQSMGMYQHAGLHSWNVQEECDSTNKAETFRPVLLLSLGMCLFVSASISCRDFKITYIVQG